MVDLYKAPEPPLDTVIVVITARIERGYTERCVFPALRSSCAVGLEGGTAAVHYLTLDKAQDVLEDARTMQRDGFRAVKVAYRAHAETLATAIEEAQRRPAEFAAS